MHSSEALEFAAPLFLRNAHLQSLCAALPLHAPPAAFRDLRAESLWLPLPDGGATLARAVWHDDPRPRPAVVVVHGVGGSSESRYVLRAAAAMYRAGFHVARLNLRGAGESITRAPSLYHAGLTSDVAAAVTAVAARPQVNGVFVMGFSLGGNVSLRLASEWGSAPPSHVRGVVTISAPLDLTVVSRAIERARSLPYRVYILRALVRQATEYARLRPERARYDAAALPRLRTIRAYDDAVVAPMHGFASAEDYYARVSAGPGLPDVRVPTLLLHAEDDPLVPGETVAPWIARPLPSVDVAWTKTGGHVGWVGGFGADQWVDTWAMSRAVAFFRAHAA